VGRPATRWPAADALVRAALSHRCQCGRKNWRSQDLLRVRLPKRRPATASRRPHRLRRSPLDLL
jgi:hypothetical protein